MILLLSHNPRYQHLLFTLPFKILKNSGPYVSPVFEPHFKMRNVEAKKRYSFVHRENDAFELSSLNRFKKCIQQCLNFGKTLSYAYSEVTKTHISRG